MHTISHEAILAQLNWRYAVKKFDSSRKIPADVWAAIERATQLAPSSYGLSPWRFLVIETPAIRAQLRPASWNQSQITDASHMVVFCRKRTMTPADIDRFVKRICDVRGVPESAVADYKKMMLGSFTNPPLNDPKVVDVWSSRQVYIALGFFLQTCALLGVDACPMEGFEPEKYDQILNLAGTDWASTVVATAGYRAADDWLAPLKKVRFPESEVLRRV